MQEDAKVACCTLHAGKMVHWLCSSCAMLPLGSCPRALAEKEHGAGGVAFLRGPWPGLGPWPGACAGRARAQAGKLRELLHCSCSALPLGWCPRPGDQPKGSVEQFEHVKKHKNAVRKRHFLKSAPLQKNVRNYSPMPMRGVGLVPARRSGKGADCPKGCAGKRARRHLPAPSPTMRVAERSVALGPKRGLWRKAWPLARTRP